MSLREGGGGVRFIAYIIFLLCEVIIFSIVAITRGLILEDPEGNVLHWAGEARAWIPHEKICDRILFIKT